MIKIFLFTALLLSSVQVWALPLTDWQSATIKIQSFPCLTESPRLQGSGLLIKKGSDLYVITSEHVLIHDQSPSTCHQILGSSLDLITADFKMGLALLKVRTPVENLNVRAIPMENLDSSAATENLIALGYPANSQGLHTLQQGKLVTADSERALIAGSAKMIEAAQLPVEFGMSGGLLLNDQGHDTTLAGILSHQILRREAGRPTAPGDIGSDPVSKNDLTLAIPWKIAFSWMQQELKNPSALIWQRYSADQIARKESLRYGSLVFSLKLKTAKDAWDVGGSDGSGIGGSDGSGIGGDEGQNPNAEKVQVLEVSFVPGAGSDLKSKAFQDPQMETWRQWLLAGRTVQVVFLKNPWARRLVPLQSLSQFLTLWVRDGNTPIAIRSKDKDLKTDLDLLLDQAHRCAVLAQAARDQATDPDKKSWFAMLRDSSVMAETALISSNEIQGMLGGENDRYWREFYDTNFDAAVALESALQRLSAQMKKMGL